MPEEQDKPWDIHPDLTEERLNTIAEVFCKVWEGVIAEHRPDKGDRMWGQGCKGYDRSCGMITILSDRYEWLDVLSPGDHLKFIFTIGGVSLRFCKNDMGLLNENISHRDQIELQFSVSTLQIDPSNLDHVWRIVVVPDEDGRVDFVSFRQVTTNGSTSLEYNVYNTEAVSVPDSLPEGVDLDSPIVDLDSPHVGIEENHEGEVSEIE